VTGRRAAGPGGLLRERWDVLLAIAAGGAIGSVGRWALALSIPHTPVQVPWATWLTNVSGAFALGVLMVFVLDFWPPSRYVRPFLGVGVLGGFTTYSTYMLDALTLLSRDQVPAAFDYVFGTLVAGLVAVWAGVSVARWAVTAVERRRRHRDDPDTADRRWR
jgi:CrcB protein